ANTSAAVLRATNDPSGSSLPHLCRATLWAWWIARRYNLCGEKLPRGDRRSCDGCFPTPSHLGESWGEGVPNRERERMMTLHCAWHHRPAIRSQRPGSRLFVIVFCLLLVVVAPQYGTAADSPLRVMTYNVYGMFVHDRVPLAVMRPHHPDLVLLQEVRNTRHVMGLGQALGLSYWHFAPYSKERGGVAILSRWPLGPAHRLFWDNSPQGKVALAAQVDSPVGRFWACSVHLDNPLTTNNPLSQWQKVLLLWQEFFTATLRTQQAQELSTWLLGLGGEGIILGGDFNSLPLAGADRHLRQYFSDALSISL